MLEYALRYAALGWAVFPCRPNDKRPATLHGCLDATTDPDQIRAWWTEIPDLNIGLACGEAPGVEIKSDGKYIILPPSIHPNGNSYEWELSSSPIEDYENDETDAALVAGDGADEESIFGPLRQPATNAA